jgi:hypothetical protein
VNWACSELREEQSGLDPQKTKSHLKSNGTTTNKRRQFLLSPPIFHFYSCSMQNNLENVFRNFFSVKFTEICTRIKFRNVFSNFFLHTIGIKKKCEGWEEKLSLKNI